MKTKSTAPLLFTAAMALAGGGRSFAVAEEVPPLGRAEHEALTGDWGGARARLEQNGITIEPRLTQFYQGMTAGDGGYGFEYGGKADVLLNADLGKFGLWDGLSLTVHAEYNFSRSVNGAGGTLVPVNVGLQFPGMEGADAFDFSSVYFTQKFGDSASLVVGKINIIDVAANKPFMGGAGIESFWNTTFAAPPSGTVPPYLLGALLSVRTEPAIFGLWVYDPSSVVNKTGFEDPFAEGVTFRGSIDFPVKLWGRSGHQGLVALYSTKDGTSVEKPDELNFPSISPGTMRIKNERYYFAYTFDQYLYQSKQNTGEGFGLFGQIGISDGNPNRLHWSALVGIGGTGLIPGRSRDNWGIGYYYDAPSTYLKNALQMIQTIRDEQGFEAFYNFAVTPSLSVGADFQIISPSLADETTTFAGLRVAIKF